MDMEKVDLNAPAFGEGSQKLEDISAEKPETESEPQEVESKAEEVPAEGSSDEEPKRVTYSRFKKFHDLADQYKQEAEQLRREAEELRARAERTPSREPLDSSEAPSWWKELYGDSEQSLKAWKIQQRANEELQTRIKEETLEAVESRQQSETKRVAENESTIDQNLELLEDYVGRELTEAEQSAILDIAEEYTPKDDDGNFMGPLIPFEKAWDIYEMKTQVSKAPKTKARDAIAALNGSQSQGTPEAEEEKNKNFNPLDWDSWKKRI